MSSVLAPSNLRCELLRHPGSVPLAVARPAFSWVVNGTAPDTFQTACRIQVEGGGGLRWDSGKMAGCDSVAVLHGGEPLPPDTPCRWRVRVWTNHGDESPWSAWQEFRTAAEFRPYRAVGEAVVQEETAPVRVVRRPDGVDFVDFGKALFGTVLLRFDPPLPAGRIAVGLGECLASENAVERQPKGTIRFREIQLDIVSGRREYRLEIPSDARNTKCPPAVPLPPGIGEILPFRYVEVTGLSRPLLAGEIVRLDTFYPFAEDASSFASSCAALDQVWDLCKHSIKATSPLGIYIDGDRERIAYEADAYINQLCHYGVDAEYAMARVSHEYLLFQPTWPTEWQFHCVLIAWADYEYTGDARSLAAQYAELQAKTLRCLARPDGLVSTETGLVTPDVLDSIHLDRPLKDIVDWPPGSFTQGGTGERDNHEMMPINTVVNAFHCQALALMARIAAVVGRPQDAAEYAAQATRVRDSINRLLLDRERGVYIDGEGSSHSSLHANMLPLAFGLVPNECRQSVLDFVVSRGMACSVYGSHYLLEALFAADAADAGLALLVAEHDRGWLNMLRAGSTVTLEAWDWKYKNNLDWNHAWGAAPAAAIPRWLVGVRPLEPGFRRILVEPRPGSLERFSARVPTIRGPVEVDYRCAQEGRTFRILVPANAEALLRLPGRDDATLGPGTHEIRVEP